MFRFAIVWQANNAGAVVSINLTDAPTVMVESWLPVLSRQRMMVKKEMRRLRKMNIFIPSDIFNLGRCTNPVFPNSKQQHPHSLTKKSTSSTTSLRSKLLSYSQALKLPPGNNFQYRPNNSLQIILKYSIGCFTYGMACHWIVWSKYWMETTIWRPIPIGNDYRLAIDDNTDFRTGREWYFFYFY